MEALVSGQYLLHLAAFALVVSAIFTRPRLVRLFAAGAGLLATVHFALVGGGLVWAGWALVFTFVSALYFAALETRARSGKLLDEERELFDEVMRVGEPGQQRHLRDLIDWRDFAAGAALVTQGQAKPPLIYVARGTAGIVVDGKRVGECGPGDFLGEMALLSGQTATATVTAAEPMRVARFDRDALAQLARAAPEVGRALNSALNRSLAAKVMRMNEVAAARGETTAL